MVCVVLIMLSCRTQKLQPKISTDKNDQRIKLLVGTWYSIPQSGGGRATRFSKLPQDTTTIIYSFEKSGVFTRDNKVRPSDTKRKWLWFLVQDKLYLESSTVEKGKCAVYIINKITKTELELEYKKTKNVYEPFLCGDGYLYFITEIPAEFGNSSKDFEKYFTTNLKLSEQVKTTDTDFIVDFVVNCNGEVCEVRPRLGVRTEFDRAIMSLIKKMPRWRPGQQRGQTINTKKQYMFIYENETLSIKEK